MPQKKESQNWPRSQLSESFIKEILKHVLLESDTQNWHFLATFSMVFTLVHILYVLKYIMKISSNVNIFPFHILTVYAMLMFSTDSDSINVTFQGPCLT